MPGAAPLTPHVPKEILRARPHFGAIAGKNQRDDAQFERIRQFSCEGVGIQWLARLLHKADHSMRIAKVGNLQRAVHFTGGKRGRSALTKKNKQQGRGCKYSTSNQCHYASATGVVIPRRPQCQKIGLRRSLRQACICLGAKTTRPR